MFLGTLRFQTKSTIMRIKRELFVDLPLDAFVNTIFLGNMLSKIIFISSLQFVICTCCSQGVLDELLCYYHGGSCGFAS